MLLKLVSSRVIPEVPWTYTRENKRVMEREGNTLSYSQFRLYEDYVHSLTWPWAILELENIVMKNMAWLTSILSPFSPHQKLLAMLPSGNNCWSLLSLSPRLGKLGECYFAKVKAMFVIKLPTLRTATDQAWNLCSGPVYLISIDIA